jgi:hypothetical protein
VDQVINHIEKVTADEGGELIRLSEQMESNEVLEGADLRQLETFLKNKDKDSVLGNLFRTVTTEGYVKWCASITIARTNTRRQRKHSTMR